MLSNGEVKIIRSLPNFSAWAKAYRRADSVFPPPVGTFRRNTPPLSSAAFRHWSEIARRAQSIGDSVGNSKSFFSIRSRQAPHISRSSSPSRLAGNWAPFINSAVSRRSPSMTAESKSRANKPA